MQFSSSRSVTIAVTSVAEGNLNNIAENASATRSRIRDTDFANETANLSKKPSITISWFGRFGTGECGNTKRAAVTAISGEALIFSLLLLLVIDGEMTRR